MNYKCNNNITYSCKYHVIWCSKYRRKVLVEEVGQRLKELIVGVASELRVDIIEMEIMPDHVNLQIESNHWEDMEESFFSLLEGHVVREQIHLLHAITWLSLTTYAWEDYDSICGAFYKGLLCLEEVL